MNVFADMRHELAIRNNLGFGGFFASSADHPLVTIEGQLGFVFFENTLYVRILCDGKHGKHPTNASKRVRW